ncbi:hypothetical protein N7448_000709 [Penicillium atrosanguineum]|uniref:Uncharacterized protein n=1 Tax=Penicillium atrosanguineum TaxID=1132637 RepID=A0A9W9Q6Q9_9EURO|nr:uncharacterized protein N7443_004106 [Penicillium atrosanguineum]KAJ5134266.1 hypothetical protein N7526_005631 [Penicillium atrosanguineum]KAJ5149131.1 hypothetical protein N7448_000709 [Penicillium atrosanguineum]KAJ5304446.1 hypothetical protein N7443_004106 [Penicillium atrosanguineum]KAJ5323917.1 hypothetical protein N7476_002517 [Penicillium atrosanguineum]
MAITFAVQKNPHFPSARSMTTEKNVRKSIEPNQPRVEVWDFECLEDLVEEEKPTDSSKDGFPVDMGILFMGKGGWI